MVRAKYETNVLPYLEQITKWSREGVYEKDMAAMLDVSPQSFSEYRTAHLELDEALKRGRKVAVVAIENALFEKALPHKRRTTITEVYQSAKSGGPGKTMTRTEEVEVDGDTTAGIFLLKSWDPDRYREKTEVNMNIKPVEIVDDVATAMRTRDDERREDTD